MPSHTKVEGLGQLQARVEQTRSNLAKARKLLARAQQEFDAAQGYYVEACSALEHTAKAVLGKQSL